MLKIIGNQERLSVIRRLEGLAKNFQKKGDKEMWWHSLRMGSSLKNELVPQDIYVDKYPDYTFLVSKYTYKDSGKNIEVFPISRDDQKIVKEASYSAIDMIANKDMSFGQIHSSPLFLYSTLWEAVKNYKLNFFVDVGANCMSFPFEKFEEFVKRIKPVDGFVCKPLRESDAELVNLRFKYGNHPDALRWMKKSIKTQPSMGCWNDKDELVGQFIVMESGNIGGLYVIDEYKGLKLGKWIVQETVKLFHQLNLEMILETEFPNTRSYNLFTDLGFETKASNYYMVLSKYNEITDAI